MRFNYGLFTFFTSFCLLAATGAQADTSTIVTQDPLNNETKTTTIQSDTQGNVTKVVETRRTVVTPVPAAKETIATPEGYVSCFMVEAGWNNDVWVPSHRVCQYTNSAQGVVWIDSYWACKQASTEGVCTNWEWKPGHWEKNLVVY